MDGFVEVYHTLILLDRRRCGLVCDSLPVQTQGHPHQVEFDWEQVWERHLSCGDVIGWYHTHPPDHPLPSLQDLNTFQSWMVALGGVRYAVITCDGTTRCWEMKCNIPDLVISEVKCCLVSTKFGPLVTVYPDRILAYNPHPLDRVRMESCTRAVQMAVECLGAETDLEAASRALQILRAARDTPLDWK